MNTNNPVKISFKFGLHQWKDLPLLQAIQMVEDYRNAEHRASDRLKKISEDRWIASFWSEVLGGSSAPTYNEWIQPSFSLQSARSAYTARKYDVALKHLNKAVSQYNTVHKKWVMYRNSLEKGANRAITVIEITNIVLSSAISGSAAVANKSLFIGATASTALTATEKLSLGAGKISYGIEDRIDFGEIILQSLGSFIGSLLGGKLSEIFIRKISAKVALGSGSSKWNLPYKELQDAASKNNILLPGATEFQKFVVGFFMGGGSELLKSSVIKSAKKMVGKKASMNDLLDIIISELPLDTLRKELTIRSPKVSRG